MVWYGNRDTGPDITVLDDFEHQDIAGNYTGNTQDYSINTASPIEGSASAQSDSEFGSIFYDGTDTTTRGNEYRVETKIVGQMGLFVGAQSTTSVSSPGSYGAFADEANGNLFVRALDSGSATTDSTAVTLSQGTVYQLGVRWDETGVTGNIEAFILDSSDTELASVAISDDTHTGGNFAVRDLSTSGDVFEYATERPL